MEMAMHLGLHARGEWEGKEPKVSQVVGMKGGEMRKVVNMNLEAQFTKTLKPRY